jgi:protein-tyrosine phosphatase
MYQQHIHPALKKIVKGYLRDRWWDIYGQRLKNPQFEKQPRSVLFICKGNICRSPFAEFAAKHIASSSMHIDSAGLDVEGPKPSPVSAVLAAQSFCIDLSGHRSKQVDAGLMEAFEMIVAMEAGQFHVLRKQYPGQADKVALLALFEPADIRGASRGYLRYNIPDPYGKKSQAFKACFSRIQLGVQGLITPVRSLDPGPLLLKDAGSIR